MKITELKQSLLSGKPLRELLPLRDGQDCTIYKSDLFTPDDTILYIPDISLNEIPTDLDVSIDNAMSIASNGKWSSMTAEEQVNIILSYCYTGEMFVDACDGDEALAWRLFCYVDWQHPTSALAEVDYDDQEDEAYVKEAYKKYRAEIPASVN